MKKTIAVFDVGKTNKKVLLFDEQLNLVYQEEGKFPEVKDDDGFERDDVENFLQWMNSTLEKLLKSNEYDIVALNFSTYGATLVFLDQKGELAAPVYNYLKPMPSGTLEGFYDKYGGVAEFSRKTASPALDMLNSGLQMMYLKKNKPEMWSKTTNIVHFPQYLSYLYTKQITSEYTSIGCHTALWDFDQMKYHKWVDDEQINLPFPVSNSTVYNCNVSGKSIDVGIGIHDSSASLVPYLKVAAGKQFLLVSSGTWAINMNPFSKDQLTASQLEKDCLCYMSVDQQQVKASRLFMGHIHEVNAHKFSEYFNVPKNEFKNVKADKGLLSSMLKDNKKVFFPDGIPANYLGDMSKLGQFNNYNEAYHQLMYELSIIEADCIILALDKKDTTKSIYITGGFVKNEIFTSLLATLFPEKEVFTADIYNATALGAAMVLIKDIDINNIKMEMERCMPV